MKNKESKEGMSYLEKEMALNEMQSLQYEIKSLEAYFDKFIKYVLERTPNAKKEVVEKWQKVFKENKSKYNKFKERLELMRMAANGKSNTVEFKKKHAEHILMYNGAGPWFKWAEKLNDTEE